MTLKSWLRITQGHWKWRYSKAWYGFLFAIDSNYGSILYRFGDEARY